MKRIYKPLLFLFLVSNSFFAQKENSLKLGLTDLEELKMTVYDRDSTANAVVLYEYANYYIDKESDYKFRTDFYYRIKIFDKNAFDRATININTYKKEYLKDIEAKTYNLNKKGTMDVIDLSESSIFVKDLNENYKQTSFTLPNIKEGSVIEYRYSLISPYARIDDWEFQTDIPKIKSEIDLAILGNYKYNIRIVGYQELDKDENYVKKYCIDMPGLVRAGDCLILFYGMNNIPAFIEEDYMTSKNNFASKIVFDLKSYTSTAGIKEEYTETWKDAEKTLKKNFLDNQTSKRGFFRRNLPEDILAITDDLQKAKKIYEYIQNYYNWNENYWNGGSDIDVKDAFEEKTGSVADINLSLFNALNAADIETNVVMLSTRANGLPTKLYPATQDFNYVLVKVTINNNEYFLDATNKFLSFGEVPLACLNGEVRVLDFKNGGYWQDITPKNTSNTTIRAELKINEEQDLEGEMTVGRTGYEAIDKREEVSLKNKEQYLESIEGENDYLLIDDYKNTYLKEFDKPFIENFKIKIENDASLTNSQNIRINPFILGRIKSNPFKLKERNYPVDFGYAIKNTYMLNLIIPENYSITKLPEDVSISLPNNGGVYIFKIQQKENKINIYSRLSINKIIFTNTEYYYLKEFYNQIIRAHKSHIEIVKKD